MASMAAFVYFWSSAYEVSGGCATDTLYPSFLRILATASQPEPSAKAPCTRTTFLICCFTTILLCGKDSFGPIDLGVESLGARQLQSCRGTSISVTTKSGSPTSWRVQRWPP